MPSHDSVHAVPAASQLAGKPRLIYVLQTEEHRIMAGGNMFSDFMDVARPKSDLDREAGELIDELNSGAK